MVDSATDLAGRCSGRRSGDLRPDDDENLEIALLARELSSDVRVVARLANSVLREAMALGNGPGAILDVADLAAPSVVEALLNRTTHTISAAGIEFVVSGADAPRTARCGTSTATWPRSGSSMARTR